MKSLNLHWARTSSWMPMVLMIASLALPVAMASGATPYKNCALTTVDTIPEVVFGYVQLSAALDKQSLSDFHSISNALAAKTAICELTVPDRRLASDDGSTASIAKSLHHSILRMSDAHNISEAKSDLAELAHLIGLWGYLNQQRNNASN